MTVPSRAYKIEIYKCRQCVCNRGGKQVIYMNRKQQAYDYLLEEILSNRLQPGEPIIELDVAAKLNSSRTPIREALKALEADGLVSQYPAKGTFVTDITPYDVEEIFNLRIMLEIYALELSFDKIGASELAQVEQLFLKLTPDSPKQAYHQADKSLHALIIDKAGNMRLKQFLNTLNVQMERFRRIAAFEPTRLANSQKEHLDIIRCIRQHDLDGCKESLRLHLNNVKASTLETAQVMFMNRRMR